MQCICWPCHMHAIPYVVWIRTCIRPGLGVCGVRGRQLGFLSYKTATLTWLWNNDLKGRLVNSISMGAAEEAAAERFAQRPVLGKLPTAEDILAKAEKRRGDK